jgi:hypothetical protein
MTDIDDAADYVTALVDDAPALTSAAVDAIRRSFAAPAVSRTPNELNQVRVEDALALASGHDSNG